MVDPDRIVLYAAVAATGGGALLVGARALGLRWAALARGAGVVLEAVGLGVVFFAANIVAGTAFIIGMRVLTGVFVSVYAMDDLVLALLSGGQALVFQAWERADK
jgi:hypothetical protein